MRNLYHFTILFAFMVISCGKYEVAEDTPECIIDVIKSLDEESVCENLKVDEYLFQGLNVYVANPGFCGSETQLKVYDKDCQLIGSLGDIVGNTNINGEDFSNAEFQRSVWNK